MASSCYEKLLQAVVDNSQSKDWNLAVMEWGITDCIEDLSRNACCICGKEKLRYLYKISNIKTHNVLFPIGSSCIKKFKRSDLNAEIKLQEQMYKLYHAMKEKKHVELDNQFFSRKLIKHLFQEGAFQKATHQEEDYLFFMEMFNRRDKTTISERQHKKIDAIIWRVVFPYLRNTLNIENDSNG